MNWIKIDREFLTNVTPIILRLEGEGMNEYQVKAWFATNRKDHIHVVDIYYEGLKAGINDPLSLDLDELHAKGLI